jgi:hypothetical protein
MSTLLNEYLDDHQLAAELDVCLETIKRWRRADTAPPVVYVGRRPYTLKSTAIEWLRSRQQKSKHRA